MKLLLNSVIKKKNSVDLVFLVFFAKRRLLKSPKRRHNPVDIERERLWGRAEAVAATQHMTNNNLRAFREDSRFAARRVEQHAIPELPDVTPIPDATVNSGPDAEAFPQELINYTEEIFSQRIPPMVYIEGNNRENMSTRVSRTGETNENS